MCLQQNCTASRDSSPKWLGKYDTPPLVEKSIVNNSLKESDQQLDQMAVNTLLVQVTPGLQEFTSTSQPLTERGKVGLESVGRMRETDPETVWDRNSELWTWAWVWYCWARAMMVETWFICDVTDMCRQQIAIMRDECRNPSIQIFRRHWSCGNVWPELIICKETD